MSRAALALVSAAALLMSCAPATGDAGNGGADNVADKPENTAPGLPNDASAIVRWFREDPQEAERRATDRRSGVAGTVRRIDRSFPGLVVVDLSTGDNPEHITAVITGDGVEQARSMRVGRLANTVCAHFDVVGRDVVASDCLAAGAEDDR